jgi:hypothetical protein
MKKLVCLVVMSLFVNLLYADNVHCTSEDVPKIVDPIKDWDIIATNTAIISTNEHFSGKNLRYSVSVHPTNAHNKIHIDAKTGKITIIAESKDHFDVIVKAKNTCGSASATFNVIIDEEE